MNELLSLGEAGISFVIGSFNRKRYIKATIKSIRTELENLDINYEIIVIDGGSTDGSISWITAQKDILLILQHNRGFWKGKEINRKSWGYFMNLGFKAAKGKYICMLSDDCLIVPDSIKNGYKQFEEALANNQKVGALAFFWREYPKLKGDTYWVGLLFGKVFVNHGLYLREALEEINFIDENSYMFYFADGDLCLRLWEKGFDCIDANNSYIEHFSHATKNVRVTNNKLLDQDRKMFIEKWGELKNNYFPLNIEKQFIDQNETYRIFDRLSPLLSFKKKMKKLGL